MRTVRYRVGWWLTAWNVELGEDGDRIRPVPVPASIAHVVWQRLSPERLRLLRRLAKAGPVSRREAARLVGRPWRSVHRDLEVLTEAGLVGIEPDGRIAGRTGRIEIEIDLLDDPEA